MKEIDVNRRTVPMVLSLLATFVAAGAVTCSFAAEPHGVNRGYMNTQVAPCEDFWQYANGA